MLISTNRVKQIIGEELWQAAVQMEKRGGVRQESSLPSQASYLVTTDPPRRIQLKASEAPSCGCTMYAAKGACIHIAAAAIAASRNGTLSRLNHIRAAESAPLLLNALESALPAESNVHMQVTLRAVWPDVLSERTLQTIPKLRIGLKVGEGRLYVVRSLPDFIRSIDEGKPFDFGKGFSFHPEWMTFSTPELKILHILRSLFAAMSSSLSALRGAQLRQIMLPDPFAVQVLEVLQEIPFRFDLDGDELCMQPIRETQLPMRFRVTGRLQGLLVDAWLPKDCVPLTTDCSWVAAGQQLIRIEDRQRPVVQVVWKRAVDHRASFDYSMQLAPKVVGELLPYLRLCGTVQMGNEVHNLLEERPLKAQVYLDRAGQDVAAQVRFCYGEKMIDPFDETPPPATLSQGEKLLLRDGASERHVLDLLAAGGFRVTKGRIWLTGNDRICSFVTEGLPRLQEKCEVYASREFERLQPRRTKLRGNIHMESGRLTLDLYIDEKPSEEILGIMEALSRRKDYFRLKDGTFLDLSTLDDWIPIAGVVTDAAASEGQQRVQLGSQISVSACRLAYLSAILNEKETGLVADKQVVETARMLNDQAEQQVPVPEGMSLRPYQERGFRWLYTLDKLHMGGILADDMGLGKTVQMISMLRLAHAQAREQNQHVVSLVVSPTSLTYNWLSELNRFAPELSVMVMAGNSQQRASQLEHVAKAKDVDVLITSYPLIRRDIELMQDFSFRFAVLDEAQQIKNAGSVGAAAVKQLKAETRFALTGTPMENSMGELWSIFDFVLPGYLGTYASFLRKYQDGVELQDLRRRIRPFLMRRLKTEVLTDLPDKLQTVLTAQMTTEQEKVYQASLARLRTRVEHIMAEKGLSRGRAEVLSAMTELRQICCHPSLVLGSYSGTSGKMELLMDILPGSLMNGHRILLFSQFTGMLKLIRRQMEENGITCLYLDGDTPSATRMDMVNRFNNGWGQVFLISLKAGGMGLNLTGADMVIHFDPWWNPAAEDQATDRAHRIGQKNKVEVIRLVTHGSIEEQVAALGQRKKALFDQLVTPGEQLVTALTEADIRALFA